MVKSVQQRVIAPWPTIFRCSKRLTFDTSGEGVVNILVNSHVVSVFAMLHVDA